MGRTSLREHILQAGVNVIHARGYAASGIREISEAAGAPQGSFTNHFQSKEAFALEVVDRYFERTIGSVIEQTLRDPSRPPVERLGAYFDAITELLSTVAWQRGCLIGNMSLEASEHSEVLREHLKQLFVAWTEPFADAVHAGQIAGSIREDLDAGDIAEALLSAWHGAMLRMKVDRSPVPLERFKRVVLATLLANPTDSPVLEKHGD